VPAHPLAALHLLVVERPGALCGGLVAELVERPPEIDRRRPRGCEHLVRRVQVFPVRGGKCETVGCGDPDGGRAAHRQRGDGVGDLRRRRAPQLDHLVRQPPLVEHDDGVGLEADDAFGF
jgi:hypothetical protein